MIIIYLILIPALILIVWMILKKKWKALIWTIGSLVFIMMLGYYFVSIFLSTAFEPECEVIRKWEIKNYEIVEKRCIGFAGPHYYPVYLYKDNEIIDKLSSIPDSTCILKFNSKNGDTLTFNICDKELEL